MCNIAEKSRGTQEGYMEPFLVTTYEGNRLCGYLLVKNYNIHALPDHIWSTSVVREYSSLFCTTIQHFGTLMALLWGLERTRFWQPAIPLPGARQPD
jgi:hypothetical protein